MANQLSFTQSFKTVNINSNPFTHVQVSYFLHDVFALGAELNRKTSVIRLVLVFA